jgi:hypothetical protein
MTVAAIDFRPGRSAIRSGVSMPYRDHLAVQRLGQFPSPPLIAT